MTNKVGELLNIEQILQKYFGFEDFRPNQRQIIEYILEGKDLLGVLPTGGGKSLCYQLPALVFKDLTIVISPLISLMKDQVDSLREQGIKAELLNSTLSIDEMKQIETKVEKGEVKILYIAPERLDSDYFINWINRFNISLLAIDEAHCVSQWGHDFRPSYRKISYFITRLKKRPIVVAFTATATEKIREDIVNFLELDNPKIFIGSFDRSNIQFIIEEPKSKNQYLLNNLDDKESTIIYANTRKNVDSIYELLKSKNYPVEKYHAGMNNDDRKKSQDNFIMDRAKIIVATNAFGMGIDKPDVRKVIHYNMPKDLESYYQEAGRGGRDGLESKAIMLFSKGDIITAKFLISQGEDPYSAARLQDMIGYSNTINCLRQYILNYFGEDYPKPCMNCSSCLEDFELIDMTKEAQMALSCIIRMEQRFGAGLVCNVLRGSKAQKVIDWKFDKLSTYGLLKDYSQSAVLDLLNSLTAENYLSPDEHGALKLKKSSLALLKGEEKFYIKYREEKSEGEKDKKNISSKYPELFEKLRELRLEISKEKAIPPYVIFHDSSLIEMSNKLPTTDGEFLNISGVGKAKCENYGESFMEIIIDYMHEEGIEKMNSVVDSSDQVKDKMNIRIGISDYTTFKLYEQGMDIEEIATERNISTRTVRNHLYNLAIGGLLKKFISNVEEWKKKEILEAIKEVGMTFLNPIKSKISDEISYEEIREVIIMEIVENNGE
jgi:ATP-dependent DNA helicase RecQ